MKQEQSPVIQLMQTVWNHGCKATGHSWQRINSSMHKALSLAITSGFRFGKHDMGTVLVDGGFRSGYWIGASSEWVYSLAISTGNYSAAQSYEAWTDRKPFIAHRVQPDGDRMWRDKERLHVGARFCWNDEDVHVTSFADDGNSLTACSYHGGDHCNVVKHRYTITRKDLLADRKDRKERAKMQADLANLSCDHKGLREEIKKKLGCTNGAKFSLLPIEKIRKVWCQYMTAEALGEKK